MTDRFGNQNVGLQDPCEDAVPATPGGGIDVVLAQPSRSIYVGGTGDLTVQMVSGNNVTFPAVPAGSILPIRVKKIIAATTIATGIIALS